MTPVPESATCPPRTFSPSSPRLVQAYVGWPKICGTDSPTDDLIDVASGSTALARRLEFGTGCVPSSGHALRKPPSLSTQPC
jgi:hypothetical protein